MLSWLSQERALIAAVIIVLLLGSLSLSIIIGLKQTAFRAKDEVFGDPERTLGGWYWTVTGISTVLLLWFYFSWGVGRAFFPDVGNEMCQIAKIETAIAPITASLPIKSRYYKSTTLIKRNLEQLRILKTNLPVDSFTKDEQQTLEIIISNSEKIIGVFSNSNNQSPESKLAFEEITQRFKLLTEKLLKGYNTLSPTQEALDQPNWGTEYIEIPLLPVTKKGVLFNDVSKEAEQITKIFVKTKNKSTAADYLILDTKDKISTLKTANASVQLDETIANERTNYLKAVERIFKRLNNGNIFPPNSLNNLNIGVTDFFNAIS